jgi:hypothetical protein
LIPPTPGIVNQFFNDSTGEGDQGEADAADRGTKATGSNTSKRPRNRLHKGRQRKSPGKSIARLGVG